MKQVDRIQALEDKTAELDGINTKVLGAVGSSVQRIIDEAKRDMDDEYVDLVMALVANVINTLPLKTRKQVVGKFQFALDTSYSNG